MQKLASLRTALTAAVPVFRAEPDRLKIFVDKGRLVSRFTAGLSYEYRYICRLFCEAFTGGPDDLMLPLALWIREHQPDLFVKHTRPGDGRDQEAIEFAADILDDKSWDIAIQFELFERVQVVAAADGSGWTITRPPEPSPVDPLLHPSLAGVGLEELSFGGARILPDDPLIPPNP